MAGCCLKGWLAIILSSPGIAPVAPQPGQSRLQVVGWWCMTPFGPKVAALSVQAPLIAAREGLARGLAAGQKELALALASVPAAVLVVVFCLS